MIDQREQWNFNGGFPNVSLIHFCFSSKEEIDDIMRCTNIVLRSFMMFAKSTL